MKHKDEFVAAGIPEDKIAEVVHRAATEGRYTGYCQGKPPGRPIFEVEYGGQKHYVSVSVGNNGYIVGANMRSADSPFDGARRDPRAETDPNYRGVGTMNGVVSVRLAPEWGTDPLWVRRDGDPIPANYAADRLGREFGVPAGLVAAIDAWDDEFQAVYDPDDPADSGFPDEAATVAWHERGERLAEQLAEVLEVRTEFHTARGDRVFGGWITGVRPCGRR